MWVCGGIDTAVVGWHTAKVKMLKLDILVTGGIIKIILDAMGGMPMMIIFPNGYSSTLPLWGTLCQHTPSGNGVP